MFLLEAFPDFWIKHIRVCKQIRGSEFKSKALKEIKAMSIISLVN